MKIAIVGIGIPGSGKTTLLKPLATRYGFGYVNRDDMREQLLGDAANTSDQPAVRAAADAAAADAVRATDGVVYDATFAEAEKRQAVTGLLRAAGADRIVGVWLQVPIKDALSRNARRERSTPENAVFAMAASLAAHPPRLSDGFDTIVAGPDADDLAETVRREIEKYRSDPA